MALRISLRCCNRLTIHFREIRLDGDKACGCGSRIVLKSIDSLPFGVTGEVLGDHWRVLVIFVHTVIQTRHQSQGNIQSIRFNLLDHAEIALVQTSLDSDVAIPNEPL
jgi:hypothetical protein